MSAPEGTRRIDVGSLVEFGALLRAMRETRGVSRMAISADLGLHERTIEFIEAGKRRPSVQMVINLADGLGLATFSSERAKFLHAAGLRAESDVDEFCPELAELNDLWIKASAQDRVKIAADAKATITRLTRPRFDNRFAGVNQGWLRK